MAKQHVYFVSGHFSAYSGPDDVQYNAPFEEVVRTASPITDDAGREALTARMRESIQKELAEQAPGHEVQELFIRNLSHLHEVHDS